MTDTGVVSPRSEPSAAATAGDTTRGDATEGDATGASVGAVAGTVGEEGRGFHVHLEVFEGPFDLLLGLIAKHQLDVTVVALSQVTDEFVAHIRACGAGWDLGEATEFLVVAATLLDLKAARLLPSGDVEDEEDLALLEARDLLFARLLQYRAYKQAAGLLAAAFEREATQLPRSVSLEPQFAQALPDLVLGIGPEALALLAAGAMRPKPVAGVGLDHLHIPRVSVREHLMVVAERLQAVGSASFRALCAGCHETIEIVARFLALLELYREGAVAFEQLQPLAELRVRWVAPPGQEVGRHLDGDELDGGAPLPRDSHAQHPQDEPTGQYDDESGSATERLGPE